MKKNTAFSIVLGMALTGCMVDLESMDAFTEGMGAEDEEALRVCAAGETLEGVDVSYYQGDVDWERVRAAGKAFAFARIGDGTYMDTVFQQNWRGIKEAGMIRGAYQFFRANKDPVVQANLVVDAVGQLGAGDLPVVLDVENASIQGKSAATMRSLIQKWVEVVEQGTGKKPIIYTAMYAWNDYVNSTAYGSYPLWVANYSVTCPNIPNGWSTWAFWQYSETGRVSGVDGYVDLDRFNGTMDDLNALAGVVEETPSFSVSWTRTSTGATRFEALPDSAVTKVDYLVDNWLIRSSTDRANKFAASYTFTSKTTGRKLEVRGYNATGKMVALATGLIDTTDGTRVFIRPVGEQTYEIGIEGSGTTVAAIEVRADNWLLPDAISGKTRSTRLAVQYTFTGLGERKFVVTAYNANGTVRTTFNRTFVVR